MISCLTGKGNLEQLLFVLPACCNFFDLRIYSWARIDFIESLSFHSSLLLFLVAECCDVNTLRSLLCLFLRDAGHNLTYHDYESCLSTALCV